MIDTSLSFIKFLAQSLWGIFNHTQFKIKPESFEESSDYIG
jgi:hypothetical protein